MSGTVDSPIALALMIGLMLVPLVTFTIKFLIVRSMKDPDLPIGRDVSKE